MIGKLISNTNILEKSIDTAVARNQAISQNIANADTPGYKRKTVSFEDELTRVLNGNGFSGRIQHEKHIPIGGGDINNITPRVKEDNSYNDMRLDGNNVDIDNEMAMLAKNTIKYNTLIQRLNGQFRNIKSVIRGGK